MKATDLICRLCKKNLFEASQHGAYLTRVNEQGVEGIWECRPDCEPHPGAGPNDAILNAIKRGQGDAAH